jgi:hypothetical protein
MAALGYFARASWLDRLSGRSVFWLTIGALGPRWGQALYRQLLRVRRLETVETTSFDTGRVGTHSGGA